MFTKVEIEVLGIVENMSFFACPKCGEETPIFSRHGAENTCSQLNTQFARQAGRQNIRLHHHQNRPSSR